MCKEYTHASYSSHMLRGSIIKPYSTIKGAFKRIAKDHRDFIYIYLDHPAIDIHACEILAVHLTFSRLSLDALIADGLQIPQFNLLSPMSMLSLLFTIFY